MRKERCGTKGLGIEMVLSLQNWGSFVRSLGADKSLGVLAARQALCLHARIELQRSSTRFSKTLGFRTSSLF